MKIKNQFLINIITFSVVLAVIAASLVITEQQTAFLNEQAKIALSVQTGASDLGYISDNYLLYQRNSDIELWYSTFSAFSNDLSKLNPTDSKLQTLLNNVLNDMQQLELVFTDVTAYLENVPRNVSIRSLPEFQTMWNRMAVQNQALTFDAQQLSQSFRNQADQLNQMNIILIAAFLGLFGSYLITNYLVTYRRTIKSISDLQAGIAIIGSGNLRHSLPVKNKDEIGEISKSVNAMAANLKTVTASKSDLEREIEEHKKTEEALKKSEQLSRQKAEELQALQVKLEEKATEVEEYASQMEALAQQRLEKLRDSECLAAIGATAGMVGHDIRNPLQAITSDAFLAKAELEALPDSEQKKIALESIEEIEKSTEYINKIVQDLQDYARPLNPRAQETNIKSVIEKVLASNGVVPDNIKTQVNVDADTELILADEDFLRRIMGNLILNAVQAMPRGGKLTIEAQKEEEYTILKVRDTGIGIPKSIQDKMFTIMFTTKSKGQGFGLAVIKRMTESLGGTVTFESEEGKGTTFIVRLPPQRVKR